jgi:hypothetical protein
MRAMIAFSFPASSRCSSASAKPKAKGSVPGSGSNRSSTGTVTRHRRKASGAVAGAAGRTWQCLAPLEVRLVQPEPLQVGFGGWRIGDMGQRSAAHIAARRRRGPSPAATRALISCSSAGLSRCSLQAAKPAAKYPSQAQRRRRRRRRRRRSSPPALGPAPAPARAPSETARRDPSEASGAVAGAAGCTWILLEPGEVRVVPREPLQVVFGGCNANGQAGTVSPNQTVTRTLVGDSAAAYALHRARRGRSSRNDGRREDEER